MKTSRKLFVLLMLMGALFAAASGCRTAHGFGEDVEKAGEKIQEGTR